MTQQIKIPAKMQEDAEWANLVDEIEMAVEDTSMIVWVGSADGRYALPWKFFKNAYEHTEYRPQGGYCALASDFVVVLDDGTWYEQDKTNGRFYHRQKPTLKPDYCPFDNVVGQEFTMAELNGDD